MNLSDLQSERNEWIEYNFPNDRVEDSIFGAVEELGELAHHFLKLRQGIRGDREMHEREMGDAVADCVIYLAGVCSWLDIDYGVLVRDTWDIVRSRDWVMYPENGVDK